MVSIALLALVGSVDGIRINGSTPAAEPVPSTGASAEPDRQRYESYEYTESGKTLRLTMPEGLAVVRGILVVGPGAGGDSPTGRKRWTSWLRGRPNSP